MADGGLAAEAEASSRKLVTNRTLWHSGRPIRRVGRSRGFRDLGFLRVRGARRVRNRLRACHRVPFATNLPAAPRRAAFGWRGAVSTFA